LVYALIINNLIQSVVLLGVGLVFIYLASNVVKVRTRYIVPVVLILAIIGTYSIDGTIAGPVTLFAFALLGVGMVRFHYPVSATVVGILLGRTLETQAIRTYQMSGGSFEYLVKQPIAMGILVVMLLSVGRAAWSRRRKALAGKNLLSLSH
jgi:putative tricarboxylic transport membrane protein